MALPNWMPISFYAVVLMVFIGVFSWTHIEKESEQKPFSVLVFIIAFMLVNDFISRMYIYPGFPLWLVVLCTYINFACMPFVGIYWYRFLRSVMTAEDRRRARVFDYIVYAISTVGLLVLFSNAFTGAVFVFDASGEYHRGPLFFFPAGATFLCIIVSQIFLLTRVRSLARGVFVSMMLFPVPPLIGGIVASIAYGLPMMPLGMTVSMIILFAVLQNTSLGVDFLTGLHNRRKLDELLQDRVARYAPDRPFAGIMIDIDDFKEINDNLGHAVGDTALAETAHLISRCVRAGDSVARYGGDEFVVLLAIKEPTDLDDVMKRIAEEADAFNKAYHGFALYLSQGGEVFDPQQFATGDDFIKRLDELMYANKLQNKLERHTKKASA